MSVNARIAEQLEDIARMMELLGEDSFRVNAHTRAARVLADYPADITTLAKADLQKIPGVGPKIAEKVLQYAETGKIAERDELSAKVPAGLLKLLEIPGVGPKTVRAMWQDLKITDIAGLEKSIADGSILALPRMGEKAVEKIKASLAFVKSGPTRLWLGKAAVIADQFVERLSSLNGVAQVSPAGSLRRGKDTIGDIDILVALAKGHEAESANIAKAFIATPGVQQILAEGESKCSVRMSLDTDHGRWGKDKNADTGGPSVQVDLRILPESSWGSALMYFTGSKEHNVRLRERAIKMGFTLNEWGLFPLDDNPEPPQKRHVQPVASVTEEDVFRALKLSYIPPEVREDRGELEASDSPRVRELLTLSDIKAELHAHTTASDGMLSIVELAEHAKARGFHTIAVTDHSKSSFQANGLSIERLEQHIENIRAASSKIKGITILAGSEVDILADGSLDYDDALLRKLDVVVASPHASLTQDPDVATKRLLAAIRHPMVHILGHPTGRLINRRPGLSPDMPKLLEAAKEHNVAMEINAHWMRLDLRDTHVRAASDAGCLIAIDCDVHEADDFDNLRFGVQTARRGWCPRDLCVNTWSQSRLQQWLRSKR